MLHPEKMDNKIMTEQQELIQAAIHKAHELCEVHEYAVANNFLLQTLKVDPTNADAWLLSGICYGCLGETKEAEEAFDKAAEFTTLPQNKAYVIELKSKLPKNDKL